MLEGFKDQEMTPCPRFPSFFEKKVEVGVNGWCDG